MSKELGIITIISGTVLIKTPDGKFHEAKVGEVVHEGDIVLGTARIALLDGSTIVAEGELKIDDNIHAREVPAAAESAILPQTSDVIVQALERGTDLNQTLDATAAGLGAGGEGGGNSFVQLGRILELTSGNRYAYGFDPLGIPDITEGVGPQTTNSTTTAVVQTPETPIDDPKDPPTEDPKDPPTDDPKDPPEDEDEDPKDPPEDEDDEDEDDKEHHDNGGGNGVDDAPGNSGDHKGDDADGHNTPGTTDTSDPKHDVGEEDHPKEEDNENPETEDDQKDPTGEHKDDEHDSGSQGNEKPHEDNGRGNGIDDAPGNSGNTKGDDADGSNTPGTDDTDEEDVIPMPVDHAKNDDHNNEKEDDEKDSINVKDVLCDDDEISVGGDERSGHGNSNHGHSDHLPVVDCKDPVSDVIDELLKNHGKHD